MADLKKAPIAIEAVTRIDAIFAAAIYYLLKRWTAFTRLLDDGRICLSNNAAERAIRPIAVGRRNWTFAGSDAGGHRAAALYTLIETAKLNGIDPQAWLTDVLAQLPDHPRCLHVAGRKKERSPIVSSHDAGDPKGHPRPPQSAATPSAARFVTPISASHPHRNLQKQCQTQTTIKLSAVPPVYHHRERWRF